MTVNVPDRLKAANSVWIGLAKIGLTPAAVLRQARLPLTVYDGKKTGVLSAKHAGCCVSALTRTFPAHELIEAGANFTFKDFLSLKRFLSIPEREAPRD
jgi:hypothetical protein